MVRMVRQVLLLGFLTASMVLVAVLATYGKKNLSNPDKVGHRNGTERSVISREEGSAIAY
jgi:hypothetical protein